MQRNVREYLTKNTISHIITVCTAVLLYLAISNFDVVRKALGTIYGVLSPFVVAFVIAFLLNTPVKWFERKIFKNLKGARGISVLCSYILALLFLSALATAILPQVAESVVGAIGSVTSWLETFTKFVEDLSAQYQWDENIISSITEYLNDFIKTLSTFAVGLLPQILDISFSVGSIFINLIMSIIASVYMLMAKERLIFQIKKMLYAIFSVKKTERILEIGVRSNIIFTGFINGKMLDSLIIGILCFIGMFFIHSPYALLIAVIVGVTNMIPFFGPFIGAVPSIFILLVVNPVDAVIFAVFVLALQQFDGNILGPKILGDSTGLAPIWVLVSIAIGGGLFGFAGMLIGVPTFAVIYSILSENIDRKLESKEISVDKEKMTISFKEEKNDE